jgi:hypothetical protein
MKENRVKIRKPCNLARLYAGPHHPILANSPELRFIQSICNGTTDEAVSLFHEKKLFGDVPPVVDVPYGRFVGLSEIRDFADGWLKSFNASAAWVTPVIQTRAGGRSATELVVNFVVGGEIEQVPMFVIGDLRTPDSLDELRVYCHFSFVPGLTPYRRPMFASAHVEVGDPDLLTGAIREYYIALHQMPSLDVDRIMRTFGDGCVFGGYEPLELAHEAVTRDELRGKYEHIGEYMPNCVGIRYETVIDDGKTCILEWVHIVTEKGQRERARVSLSGVAAYERGDDGLLCSIRVCDYANFERQIDWKKTPVSKEDAHHHNLVREFTSTVGSKHIE